MIYREMGSIDFLKMRRAIVPALNALKPWQGLSPIPPNPQAARRPEKGPAPICKKRRPFVICLNPDRRRMCAYPHPRKRARERR